MSDLTNDFTNREGDDAQSGFTQCGSALPLPEGDDPTGFERFVERIEYLRGPDGCPWDRKQTHESITKNMIEEAYEAVDAIESGSQADTVEELGDVLLQVVLQSQIAADNGEFTIRDVVDGIDEKIVRRHPHVWGENAGETEADAALKRWEAEKRKEKAAKAERAAAAAAGANGSEMSDGPTASGQPGEDASGLLVGIPRAMPALMQAQNISRKAVGAGFEWETTEDVWAQVHEEIAEFNECERGSQEAVEEFGDVLFSLVNVARKEGIDAETALRLACDKFRRRWSIMEACARERGKRIDEFDVDTQEEFWTAAKARENR